jgi:glucosyl-dolichyl phosphate glucuronosyltransferase
MADGARETIAGVVCTHDEQRWDALVRAVESLRRQTRRLDEIIVVVDQNPALLARVRRELAHVRVVANERTSGLSGARNTAVETAASTFVAFLDDDAAALPDWIERLERRCADPHVLGAGGRVTARWLGPRPSWFPDEFLWVVGCTYRGMPTRPSRVRNLYGGCFCIRRDVVRETGGFQVELGRVGANGMGCEETELCIRASGLRPGDFFYYEPEAVIEHDVPANRGTWTYFRSRCFAEGVSKARLTRLVGTRSGLSSERNHAFRTLPAGAVRELFAAVFRRDTAPLARAAAIVAGLVTTGAGYLSESARLGAESASRMGTRLTRKGETEERA